jgi:peptide/nickel transport system substrate-binding protein
MVGVSTAAGRRYLAAVVAPLLLLFVAGCGRAAAPGPAAGDATPAQRQIARLTVALPRDGGPLNVYLSSYDILLELVHDKLFAPSPFVPDPEPALAERATQLDPSTWVVELRRNVTWHDGQPFTADDVKFTYESYRDGEPNRHTHHVSDVPRIERIEAVDPYTVRFECGYPCPSLDRITMADLPILPKHIWGGITSPRTFRGLPVGTGPYRLAEYQPDKFYRFEANQSYFGGRPLVDELMMPIIKDQTATFVALRTGQVDAAARDVPPEVLAEFRRNAALKLLSTAPLSITELRLNYMRPPFDRPEFRRALSLATDREALVTTLLLGHGRPGLRGYPHPDSPWTAPNLSTPFDLTQARRMLDQIGFTDRNGDGVREQADGTPLTFVIKVDAGEPTWVRAAELLARQYSAAGLKVTVEALDGAVLSRQASAREFDMYVSEIGPHGAADPDQFIMSHRSGYLWRAGLPYPEMDALWEEWRAAATVETRKQVAFRMQELFNRQPTSLALYYPEENWAVRPAAYDLWAESRGYGIVHKWSFLPLDRRGGTVVR